MVVSENLPFKPDGVFLCVVVCRIVNLVGGQNSTHESIHPNNLVWQDDLRSFQFCRDTKVTVVRKPRSIQINTIYHTFIFPLTSIF